MALPKLVTPTYDVILPSKKEVVKVRPFLMKEEKVLLMAAEGGEKKDMIDAVRQMISGCVLSDKIVAEDLPLFDIEYLFLKIRAKSVGETITVTYGHSNNINSKGEECSHHTPVIVNLDEVEIIHQEGHNPKIELTPSIGMIIGYPKMEVLDKIANADSYEDGLKLIANCIDMVYDGDNVTEKGSFTEEEIINFLETLSKEQFNSVEKFFETMPRVKHETNYTCEGCGDEVKVILEGLDDFFG